MSRCRALCGGALALAMLAGCAELQPRSPPPASTAKPAAKPASTPPTPPTPPVRHVYPPKPAKCVPEDLGPPPAYPDTDTALRDAGGAADRYQSLLAAGRILREQRLTRLEEVIRRCRNASH